MKFCTMALSVIETEAQAIFELAQHIDDRFAKACEIMLACQGRIVVTGIGKSGHIANKIAATLASTGTPAFFLHPSEASHGDLGMITPADVVLAVSYSGNTHEVVTLLPLLKRMQVPLITLTGNPQSAMAQAAEVNLDVSIKQEACPLGLAPTTSTTAALVMGDALAVALLDARGFTAEDFAFSHPGGSLGKKLLLRVDDIWHAGTALPVVSDDCQISDALIEVTAKKLGMTCVVDQQGLLAGIYTDGDVRRTLARQLDIRTTPLREVMTANCRTIPRGIMAAEALAIMQQHAISCLIVEEDHRPLAVVHIHDILKAGII